MFALAQFWAGSFWALGILSTVALIVGGVLAFCLGFFENDNAWQMGIGLVVATLGICLWVGLASMGAPHVF